MPLEGFGVFQVPDAAQRGVSIIPKSIYKERMEQEYRHLGF